MLLGGLRRCEVLGLRLCDVNVGERRVHITCGKGGRERIVPVSGRFFAALGDYLELERPAETVTEACFVVLKGPRRGLPLSPSGLDEVLDGARARAGLARCTCHQLRHTCLTRLREQGMALEAVQAQGECRRNRVSVAERISHAYENSQQNQSRRRRCCCQRGAKRPQHRGAARA